MSLQQSVRKAVVPLYDTLYIVAIHAGHYLVLHTPCLLRLSALAGTDTVPKREWALPSSRDSKRPAPSKQHFHPSGESYVWPKGPESRVNTNAVLLL